MTRAPAGKVRLQRRMAEAGVASRRACEELIEQGRVRVNGEVVRRLPVFVDPREDHIEVSGRVLPYQSQQRRERKVYVMLNKPPRVVTTAKDEVEMEGDRRTVLDLVVHPSGARLYPVGRLDYATGGLILLTNDGELANRLTHPRYGVHKTYRAVVRGRVEEETLAELERGIYLAERKEGRTVGATRAAHVSLKVSSRTQSTTTLEITLAEGRNRQVRRMLAAVGSPVKKLTRVKMGPLELTGVAVGQWRELGRHEVRALKAAAKGESAGKEEGGARNGAAPRRPRHAGTEKASRARPSKRGAR